MGSVPPRSHQGERLCVICRLSHSLAGMFPDLSTWIPEGDAFWSILLDTLARAPALCVWGAPSTSRVSAGGSQLPLKRSSAPPQGWDVEPGDAQVASTVARPLHIPRDILSPVQRWRDERPWLRKGWRGPTVWPNPPW